VAVETAATLLERERELSELGNALAEAREGGGRALLVEAPAGLGKTTLLWAASETAAEAGFTCLRARASELERDFAYGCVRQLLEPAVAKLSDPERDRIFEGAASLSKPLFAPTDAPSPSADSSFSILHGLYWLLNNLADEGPVALCVDDLQWSDPESLRFLNYLGRRGRQASSPPRKRIWSWLRVPLRSSGPSKIGAVGWLTRKWTRLPRLSSIGRSQVLFDERRKMSSSSGEYQSAGAGVAGSSGQPVVKPPCRRPLREVSRPGPRAL
jgi:predicted ATPase